MKDGKQLSKQQIELTPLTVGKLKQILAKSELSDDARIFADYPNGWSGIFQVYKQDGDLYLLASDNDDDSGIGGGTEELDTLLWQTEGFFK